MHTGLDIRAKQHLLLTPRLQQSVRLLQLSSLEFTQEIQQALATNPFLEEEEIESEEEIDEDHDESPDEDRDFSAAASATDDNHDDDLTLAPSPDTQDSTDSEHNSDDSEMIDFSYAGADGAGGSGADAAEWLSSSVTLREHLHQELGAYRLGERDRVLAELIIDSLDDDGYLREELAEMAAMIEADPQDADGIDENELRAALHLVQHLEPAGIGARTLAECLELQLNAVQTNDRAHELALAIVRNYLALVASRDTNELKRLLECSHQDLQSALVLIRRLDPRPGARFNARLADYIVPEIIVRKTKSGWTASVNPDVMPRARLNNVYADMFQKAACGDRAPLAQQLQEAQWLLRNAQQRFVTIQRVAQALVKRQRTFLEYGDVGLKPLVLRQIAEELGIHESTVSRATSNKYMATPRGIFELRHFFSRELATETGGKCSAAAIRALLKEMIEAEPCHAPLSDVSLTQMLADQGVIVARRTVSKYRGMMKVAPAELRRQI